MNGRRVYTTYTGLERQSSATNEKLSICKVGTDLAGNTSGDDNNFGALEGLVEFVCRVAIDLLKQRTQKSKWE